tara:strand:- start:5 stop:1411 length:1407 start_codon:yes stop_codon:yes gene_type:complete
MSCNLNITTIDGEECIGDSLDTINSNFANLNSITNFLSARVDSVLAIRSAGVTTLSGNYIVSTDSTINNVTVSEKFCPPWHIGLTGKPLYQETGANRISQQVALSAEFFQYLQYITTQNSTMSGATSYTESQAAFPNGLKQGVQLSNGSVYCLYNPASNLGGPSVIYNPITNTTSNAATVTTGNTSSGGVLMANGNVFIVPTGVGMPGIIYNPATNSLTNAGGTHWGVYNIADYRYHSAVLLADGRVFVNPAVGGIPAIIYDPVTDSTSVTPSTFSGPSACCALLPNGTVYRIPSYANIVSSPITKAHIYNPYTNTVIEAGGTYPSNLSFFGSCVMADGRVFIAPNGGGYGLIYNPFTNSLSQTNTGFEQAALVPGSVYYAGCSLMPDGRIYLTKYLATQAAIYNPITNTILNLNINAGTYAGTVTLKNGRILNIPYNNAITAKLITSYYRKEFALSALTGPFLNKAY